MRAGTMASLTYSISLLLLLVAACSLQLATATVSCYDAGTYVYAYTSTSFLATAGIKSVNTFCLSFPIGGSGYVANVGSNVAFSGERERE